MSSLLKRRAFGFAVLFCPLLLVQASRHAHAQEQAQPHHEQQPEAVTVCAYNLQNWLAQTPLGAEPGAPPITKPETAKARVVAFLKQIRPDILGICEIGTPADLEELQARLKEAGLDLPHHAFSRGADPLRSLALLSRFPIVAQNSPQGLEYPIGDKILPMQRGILDATVQVSPSLQVRLLGVHLKSQRPDAEADQELMRRNEAHLLRRYMDEIFATAPETKLLCYGDFNEHRNGAAISAVIGSRASPHYMSDVFLRDSSGLVWTHFWNDADVYSRLDYFFVSRSLRPHVDSRKSFIFASDDFAKASDHRPIVLGLKTHVKAPAKSGR